MYISKIWLHNFKSFSGSHELELCDGINFFVGNNNCGKTTIFKAIEFIQSGKNKLDYITKGKEDENVCVEIEFSGKDIKDLVDSDHLNLSKYRQYITEIIGSNDEEPIYSIRVMRSSEETKLKSKKGVLDIKNVRVYNPSSREKEKIKRYENPTGIDKTITALFDPQYVYSDLKNEDYQDFGKTKIVGKMINDITREFQNEPIWRGFTESYREAFGEKGLSGILSGLEKEVSDILAEQYGEGEVEFDFAPPEIDILLKTGNILLSDNGIKTPVSDKGTGMQRALALSLIQVYAKKTNKLTNGIGKPIIFCIDEPETFLHPKAQDRLMEAFMQLSHRYQIFITTHSPYLLKYYDKKSHQITIFSKGNNTSQVKSQDMLDLFSSYSPSWGEINYFAFDVLSVEFHNELYGYMHYHIAEIDSNYSSITKFDNWLRDQSVKLLDAKEGYMDICKDDCIDLDYIRESNGKMKIQKVTLPTIIRNIIHHPENRNNNFSTQQLDISTRLLVGIIKQFMNTEKQCD
ncbi:ATP-dependent nuclease [Stomatohabitans albus]|uniref:ATP-dependent nuclease n=1 Tax=Stomatohabitans albus TaxID=3110766 RepID=UPI00300D508F